jgi:hypothetical protein
VFVNLLIVYRNGRRRKVDKIFVFFNLIIYVDINEDKYKIKFFDDFGFYFFLFFSVAYLGFLTVRTTIQTSLKAKQTKPNQTKQNKKKLLQLLQ